MTLYTVILKTPAGAPVWVCDLPAYDRDHACCIALDRVEGAHTVGDVWENAVQN